MLFCLVFFAGMSLSLIPLLFVISFGAQRVNEESYFDTGKKEDVVLREGSGKEEDHWERCWRVGGFWQMCY